LQRWHKAASWFYMLKVNTKLPDNIPKRLIAVIKQEALAWPDMLCLQVAAKEEALSKLVFVLFERPKLVRIQYAIKYII